MGIQTVAEYVENVEILEKLRKIGVGYAQGYGVSKPMLLEDVTNVSPFADCVRSGPQSRWNLLPMRLLGRSCLRAGGSLHRWV